MCQNHNHNHANHYEIRTTESSTALLKEYRRQYTYDCCPKLPKFLPRVEQFESIIGHYPVVVDKFHPWRNDFYSTTMDLVPSDIWVLIRSIISNLTEEEFYSNQFAHGNFEALKAAFKQYEDKTKIRVSSPKISKFLLQLLEHVKVSFKMSDWMRQMYTQHMETLIKKFNDRGSNSMDEYELVISTEPHRIAGMSAFGHYTSCQDWIQKDEDHSYHNYTHHAWANHLDPTVGVAFLRKIGDDEDIDMYARSLVRLCPLENGETVVYFHRIYAESPYHDYMMGSLKAIKLPEHYHVKNLWEDNNMHGEGTNMHGVVYEGASYVKIASTHYISVTGCGHNHCSYCDGEGTVTCPDCEGSGRVNIGYYSQCSGDWVETGRDTCPCCDGDGYIECEECGGESFEEEYEPYNDHSGIIQFYGKSVQFLVPNYILHYTEGLDADETIAI